MPWAVSDAHGGAGPPYTLEVCEPRDIQPAKTIAFSTRRAQIGFSGADEKTIDSAALQRIADLNAFRLVREGSDLQAIERPEIAPVGLSNMRLKSGQLLVLLADLLP